jgi:hypothetical protein
MLLLWVTGNVVIVRHNFHTLSLYVASWQPETLYREQITNFKVYIYAVKWLVFCGTITFVTVYTTARYYRTLSWIKWINSTRFRPVSVRSTSTLHFYLWLDRQLIYLPRLSGQKVCQISCDKTYNLICPCDVEHRSMKFVFERQRWFLDFAGPGRFSTWGKSPSNYPLDGSLGE